MNTSLHTTLNILNLLSEHSYSAAELQRRCDGISLATLKRHIAEGRELGAKIESLKSGSTWCYHLKNKDAIAVRLHIWLELESTRDLHIHDPEL